MPARQPIFVDYTRVHTVLIRFDLPHYINWLGWPAFAFFLLSPVGAEYAFNANTLQPLLGRLISQQRRASLWLNGGGAPLSDTRDQLP